MALHDPMAYQWEEALDHLDRAARMQRRFFQPGNAARHSPSWEPPADVFECDGVVHVVVALPGVAPTSIDVFVDDATLVVRGERALPEAAVHGHIRRLEMPHGMFERSVELPSDDYRILQQSVSHGCLAVTLETLTKALPI